MNRRKETQVKPFLKWVGGKARRVNEILDLMPEQIDYYMEPFLGGGAVALEVLRRNPDCKALLSDLNPHLINCWRQVKENPQGVIRSVHALDDRYLRLKFASEQKSFYMAVRERWNIYMAVLERCNESMDDEDIVREIYGQPDSVSEIPCTFTATNAGRRTRNEFIITNNLRKLR